MSERITKLIIVSDACCQIENAHLQGRARHGQCACGVVYLNGEKDMSNLLDKRSKFLGEMTAPEAEYNALIYALDEASGIARCAVEAWLDSELVVRHLNGLYRLKASNLKLLYDRVKQMEPRFKGVTYQHHSRENAVAKEADRLAHVELERSIS